MTDTKLEQFQRPKQALLWAQGSLARDRGLWLQLRMTFQFSCPSSCSLFPMMAQTELLIKKKIIYCQQRQYIQLDKRCNRTIGEGVVKGALGRDEAVKR